MKYECDCFLSTPSKVQGTRCTKHCKPNVNYSNKQKLLDSFQPISQCAFVNVSVCTFVCVTEKNNRQMAVRYSSRLKLSES